ncbi:MAG: helix-turn-helix transcriptional regulator [Eisenbergiella massiliensis]
MGYPSKISVRSIPLPQPISAICLRKRPIPFFNNYLNTYRLEKAREQLVNSQEKVNTIAEKNGFTSTSYFITSFKKYTGMSPQKYREQNQ